jgi:mannose-1-phosphate guanylyltransferase
MPGRGPSAGPRLGVRRHRCGARRASAFGFRAATAGTTRAARTEPAPSSTAVTTWRASRSVGRAEHPVGMRRPDRRGRSGRQFDALGTRAHARRVDGRRGSGPAPRPAEQAPRRCSRPRPSGRLGERRAQASSEQAKPGRPRRGRGPGAGRRPGPGVAPQVRSTGTRPASHSGEAARPAPSSAPGWSRCTSSRHARPVVRRRPPHRAGSRSWPPSSRSWPPTARCALRPAPYQVSSGAPPSRAARRTEGLTEGNATAWVTGSSIGSPARLPIMRYVVIMAGGSGTRLWPLSRKGTPKQLLKLIEGAACCGWPSSAPWRSRPGERILVVTGCPLPGRRRRRPARGAAREPARRARGARLAQRGAPGRPPCWPAAIPTPSSRSSPPTSSSSPSTPSSPPRSRRRSPSPSADRRALVTLGVVPTSAAHRLRLPAPRAEPLPGLPTACTGAGVQGEARRRHGGRLPRLGASTGGTPACSCGGPSTVLDQLARSSPPPTPRSGAGRTSPSGSTRSSHAAQDLGRLRDHGARLPRQGHRAASSRSPCPSDWRDVGGFASLAEVLTADAGQRRRRRRRPARRRGQPGDQHRARPRRVAVRGTSDMVVVHTPDATLVTTLAGAENVKAAGGPESRTPSGRPLRVTGSDVELGGGRHARQRDAAARTRRLDRASA